MFETETGEITVNAGEVLRVPPGMFQLGTNHGDERVTAITLGAPREYQEETQWLVECDKCSERTVHILEQEEEGDYLYRCMDCDTETYRVPQ